MTPAGAKIDPALEGELAAAEAAGDPAQRMPVLVELAGRLDLEGGGLPDAERAAGARQAGVLARLLELGAKDVQPLVLANAVAASLTADQIRDVAAREDVAAVRLARSEHVTT